MAIARTAQGQTGFTSPVVTEPDVFGPKVDELECAGIARYQSMRALADMIEQAARRAYARARLEAVLARQA
jgi:hypothetical protein